jgi:type VII secretion protein EccE
MTTPYSALPRAARIDRRARHRLLPRLLVAELAAAALLTGYRSGPGWLAVAAPVAVAALLLAFGRADHRWLTDCLLLRWRYARRRATRATGLARLAPDLVLGTIHERAAPTDVGQIGGSQIGAGRVGGGRAGVGWVGGSPVGAGQVGAGRVGVGRDGGGRNGAGGSEQIGGGRVDGAGGSGQIGVGQDGGGWFAAVAVSPGYGAVPLAVLAGLLTEPGPPLSAVQLVLQAVPAGRLDPGSPAARSYRVLAAGLPAPAETQCWIAVRLAPAVAAEAAASRGGGPAGVHRALTAAVGRLGAALTGAGLAYTVLDRDALHTALVTSCGSGYRDGEGWRSWRSGGLRHTCFWVRDWPPLADAGRLIGELARTPAVLASVSLTLRPARGDLDLRCLVRVASAADQLPASCRALRGIARAGRARLLRLDGEQAPAVYAAAPTGGGAW